MEDKILGIKFNGKEIRKNSLEFLENVTIQTNEKCRVIRMKKGKQKPKIYVVKNKLSLRKNGQYFLILTKKQDGKTILIDFLIQKKKSAVCYLFFITLFTLICFNLGSVLYNYKTTEDISNLKIPSENGIAVWNFKVNENQNSYQEINFADTIIGTQKENLISPGKSGKFYINIDTENTEVDLKYMITIKEEKNKPRNLYFYFNEKKYSSMSELAKIELNGKIDSNEKEKKKRFCIYWNWPYENYENNLFDEIDGKNANLYRLKFSIVGMQI